MTKRFFLKHKRKSIVLLLIFVLWFFCLPKPLFDAPLATVVKSREGILLGARIAEDGQWRFPALDSIPFRFEQCLLYFEDEYFYKHPGFNPIAIAKAIKQNMVSDKRRGGSTLTQQVIRLSRKNKGRTYLEKIIEIFQATRLEAGYSKKEILNFYATYAPFGGNVVGLETAAWRYFRIPAQDLSWGQSAALAVLPNAPSLIFPGKNENLLKQKRNRLLKKLYDNTVIDQSTYELAILEHLPRKPYPLPQEAAHFTEKIKKEFPQQIIKTTLNASLQKQLNSIAKDHYLNLKQNQIHNLAILVLDVETREVLGYVGNAPTTAENQKYVDIIDKPRSTGSVLKPFLYAAMLEDGMLLPNTLVADIPTSINGYQPKNFDKTFYGAVPANIALTRSLNVPAVRMLRRYGLQRFYNKLKSASLGHINKPASHYGLSLILGGAESSLWEITKLYAGMASTVNFFTASSSEYRQMEFTKLNYVLGNKTNFGTLVYEAPVIDAGSFYHTLNTLGALNRPEGEENWEFYEDAQALAWKTGTSFGFKDAWAVGTTPTYTIGVWVGNADGEGRPGLTGMQAAAPILFDVLKTLPNASKWFNRPYDELSEEILCDKSGYLAGLYCTETSKKWIPKNGVKSDGCPFHHRIFLDETQAYRVHASCYPLENIHATNWFSLPPVIEYYYAALHPEYKALPPLMENCESEGEQAMAFIYPKNKEAIILPKNFEEEVNDVILKVAHRNAEAVLYWYLDTHYIGSTQTFHELAIVPKPGNYNLLVVDQEGNEVKQQIVIKPFIK